MSDTPDRDQKTQAPSAKRRREAAAKGDILQSRDLATALVVLAGAGWVAIAGPWLVRALLAMLRAGLTLDRADLDRFDPSERVATLGLHALAPVATLLAVTLAAAIAGPALLGSLGFRVGAFAVRPAKLNPAAGLHRIFGPQGLIELGKSLLKVVLLGAIGWWLLSARMASMIGLAAGDTRHAIAASGTEFATVFLAMAAGLVVIGLIDAPIQLMQRTARLRMTREEVKQENRESEGSPETKGMANRRRSEILSGSARRAVGEASVILTNPTHFAVALRYRPGTDAVPMVVARGRGETALAIKALAQEAAVPQLEYPQLARAIYFTTRAGQPISADLYLAVATILAFVFNLDRAMAEGLSQPSVGVPPGKAFDERGNRTG